MVPLGATDKVLAIEVYMIYYLSGKAEEKIKMKMEKVRIGYNIEVQTTIYVVFQLGHSQITLVGSNCARISCAKVMKNQAGISDMLP